MTNVVAYCRVSTNEKDQLNSLKTQQEFFEDFASKKGWNLVHTYSDQGISGTTKKNRAAFNQMMLDAQKGLFQIILFKDVSRLSRNTLHFFESYRMLKALGIKILTPDSDSTNMEDNELVMGIKVMLAQEESHNTSKRIKLSKSYNAEKGRVPNLVFGYDKIIGDYFHLNVNEDEAKTVKTIFKKYTEDGDGTLKISQMLNAMGIRTKRGCKWSQNAVARILSNEIYVGKVVNGKYEIVNFPDSKRVKRDEKDLIVMQNDGLRIIDDATFEKAQALMKERSRAFHTEKTRHSNQYLFSTLIKCAHCGRSFRRTERTYKNTYVRWVCSSRNGHGTDSCENTVSIDENKLIEAIQKYFSDTLLDKEKARQSARTTFLTRRDQIDETEQKREALNKKIAELKKRKEKMILLFSKDLISMDELDEELKPLRIEIPRLELELKNYTAVYDRQAFEKSVDAVFHNIENVTDIRALSNAQLKELIREIRVYKNGCFDIYLNDFA